DSRADGGLRLGDAARGQGWGPLRPRIAPGERRNPAARAVCAPGQQLSRLRLCLLLAGGPQRCGAEAQGVAAMITAETAEFGLHVTSGKLAGLDVGTKTIRRTKFTQDMAALRTIVEREKVAGLVIGLPLSMDGSDSPRTQSTRAFARNLAPLGLPILLWDERWSTQAVERAMIEADVSRAKRAEKVDALAAAHILQGAIDALV